MFCSIHIWILTNTMLRVLDAGTQSGHPSQLIYCIPKTSQVPVQHPPLNVFCIIASLSVKIPFWGLVGPRCFSKETDLIESPCCHPLCHGQHQSFSPVPTQMYHPLVVSCLVEFVFGESNENSQICGHHQTGYSSQISAVLSLTVKPWATSIH